MELVQVLIKPGDCVLDKTMVNNQKKQIKHFRQDALQQQLHAEYTRVGLQWGRSSKCNPWMFVLSCRLDLSQLECGAVDFSFEDIMSFVWSAFNMCVCVCVFHVH